MDHDDVPSPDIPLPASVEAGASRRRLLTGMGAAAAGAGVLALAGAPTAEAATANGRLLTVGPDRIIDTRDVPGGFIRGGQTQTRGEVSGEDATLVANVTVVNTSGYGYLEFFSANAPRPANYSTINWQGAGKVVNNLAFIDFGLDGFKVYCGGGAGTSTDFIVDVIGFFISAPVTAMNAQEKALLKRIQKASAARGSR